MFTKEFCDDFIEELVNFENSDMPKGRPNTMNNYGVWQKCFLLDLSSYILAFLNLRLTSVMYLLQYVIAVNIKLHSIN